MQLNINYDLNRFIYDKYTIFLIYEKKINDTYYLIIYYMKVDWNHHKIESL